MSVLAEMPGLVLDGQTSGPTPERGRLLELAWARLPAAGGPPPGPRAGALLRPPQLSGKA